MTRPVKSPRRQRTPAQDVPGKIQAACAAMIARGERIDDKRAVAREAGISRQTLYNHGLEAYQNALRDWLVSQKPNPEAARKRLTLEQQLEKERVARIEAERKADELAALVTQILINVDTYAQHLRDQIMEPLDSRHSPLDVRRS